MDDLVVIEDLDHLFNFSKDAFGGCDDQRVFEVIWIISFQERIWTLVFHSNIDFGWRARCLVSMVSLFKDTILPRAQNPNSILNLVCTSFFDRVRTAASYRPNTVSQSDQFVILDTVMHCLQGHHGILDNSIDEVRRKWYPES